MKDEQQIKEVIGSFIGQEAATISSNTAIDRSVIKSSILVHRMYAALADAGLIIEDHADVRTFGDLQKAVGGGGNVIHADDSDMMGGLNADGLVVGIDIENIAQFDEVGDFREDSFYQQNFSPAEIAWCIRQPQPLASFCGKFAAKEAIVKADNRFKEIPFNKIEILNAPSGKPQFQGFGISIAHTSTTTVAIAISLNKSNSDEQGAWPKQPKRDYWLWLVSILAFLLALVSCLIK